jgi:ribosomal protein S18 acetylase RimI-like enzyme
MRGDIGEPGPSPVREGLPVEATAVRPDALLELTHALRAALLEKGEFLPPTWVEEAANDLRAGRLRGWVLEPTQPVGLAFFSPRPGRAYGHVHVVPGPEGVARARRLLDTLGEARSHPGERLDVGLTGLGGLEEADLRATAQGRTDQSAILRFAMECTVPPQATLPTLPAGFETYPLKDVTSAQLAALDWTAFRGTPDETLVADSPEEDQRVIEEIRRGLLGGFLEEASLTILDREGALVAFLLTAEQTPRRAIFLDLVTRADTRRQGLAGFLMRWGIRALAALGYESVRLWVTESNVPARALYDRLGFRENGRALIYRFSPTGPAAPQPQRS